MSGQEQDALRSEALDEDAVILACVRTILPAQRKEGENQCTTSKHSQRRTDWVELIVAIFHGSTNVAPIKTCPSVIQRTARQRNLCIRSVVIENGRSP
jgi:hypothetical protein